MRDLDKPQQTHWQIESQTEKIASRKDKDKNQAAMSQKKTSTGQIEIN